MTPDALKVATDILRELGMEDVARWVEHPEAVRTLLKDPPSDRNGECPGAKRDCYGTPYAPHHVDCEIAAAWRAIGDPKALLDLENAHEDANADNRCRIHKDATHGQRCTLPSRHDGRHKWSPPLDGRWVEMAQSIWVEAAPATALTIKRT